MLRVCRFSETALRDDDPERVNPQHSSHKVDFLLGWCFKHIANPVIQARVAARLSDLRLDLSFICTPEELAGDDDE
jgi:hypothetical protein